MIGQKKIFPSLPFRALERQRNLLGLRVEDWTLAELVEALEQAVIHHIPVHVWGINIPLFAMVRSVPELIDFSHQFDVVIADGAGIPIFGFIMRQHIRAHVATPHLADEIIKLSAQKGYRILLFGATPEMNSIANRNLIQKYPQIKLCQGIDGYYLPESEADIAKQIRDLKPDILLVGMAVPKKEKFLLKWKDYMNVPVGIACGGYIDVLAGKTNLAPKIIERLAMSWLWRFLQEPKRLFSKMFVGGLLFIFYIFPVAFVNRILSPKNPIDIFKLFPKALPHKNIQ
jgi:N-acetylglucosaminyldiphosphoundecaprenol N-acetyl-beta-D-mannosaminyltransferase